MWTSSTSQNTSWYRHHRPFDGDWSPEPAAHQGLGAAHQEEEDAPGPEHCLHQGVGAQGEEVLEEDGAGR